MFYQKGFRYGKTSLIFALASNTTIMPIMNFTNKVDDYSFIKNTKNTV